MERAATTTLSTAALLLAATAASGQIARNGITILVGDDTLMPGESTTIRMEAYFDPMDHCMAGLATGLLSSAGAQGLSDPRLVFPMAGPGTFEGLVSDDGVIDIRAGQLHGMASIYGDPSNPIVFWEATYTAPADVAVAFEVGLMTETTRFDVYLRRDSASSQSRLGDLAEGEATIRVVPAPAGVVVLGGIFMMGGRRRRTAVAAGAVAAALATPVMGQIANNGITILVGDDTLMPGESTTIRMEAYFDVADHAMGYVAMSLLSSAGAQGLSDPRLVGRLDGPGASEGLVNDMGVIGIIGHQIHGLAGIYGDTSNPIAFWEATYTAPSEVVAPFDVALMTETTRFDVYFRRDRAQTESRLGDFAEGEATIRVVPAPAGAAVLGGLLLMARRRR